MTPQEFKAARLELGLSQREMASDLGVFDQRTVRRWEHGERRIPGEMEIVIAYWLRDKNERRDRIVLVAPAHVVIDEEAEI